MDCPELFSLNAAEEAHSEDAIKILVMDLADLVKALCRDELSLKPAPTRLHTEVEDEAFVVRQDGLRFGSNKTYFLEK
jgi:hypothetical protein